MNPKIYYYKFKPFNAWLLFNIIITLLLCLCSKYYPQMWYYPQTSVLVGVILFSWVTWYYKYIHPQTMAVVTDEDITIDHNDPLRWDDIAYAEEREVYCCFKMRKIIVLVPHDGINYNYNWLQKHNAGFTPFSIPLYGLLTPQDEAELTALIDKKIGLKRIK